MLSFNLLSGITPQPKFTRKTWKKRKRHVPLDAASKTTAMMSHRFAMSLDAASVFKTQVKIHLQFKTNLQISHAEYRPFVYSRKVCGD